MVLCVDAAAYLAIVTGYPWRGCAWTELPPGGTRAAGAGWVREGARGALGPCRSAAPNAAPPLRAAGGASGVGRRMDGCGTGECVVWVRSLRRSSRCSVPVCVLRCVWF